MDDEQALTAISNSIRPFAIEPFLNSWFWQREARLAQKSHCLACHLLGTRHSEEFHHFALMRGSALAVPQGTTASPAVAHTTILRASM